MTQFCLRCSLAALLLAVICGCAFAQQPSEVSVADFGAKGDGVTDDTAAFQAAMGAVAEKGGIVRVPVGNFLIKTHINVPANVTLEGVWKTPTSWAQHFGSTLLAVEGAGSEDGPAFITLNDNSTIKGLTVFYPNQSHEDIQPYPWCVAGSGGDNSGIVDCLLVNPYQGVDFGTKHSGRHYIRNLFGQPLRRGIFVDKCYDIGRIENVHFWPFWYWDHGGDPAKSDFAKWWTENGEAFIFGRTDWEYVINTFCFGYGIGYRFIETKDGATNGNFLGLGADAANVAVLVEATQLFGLLITNGEFVSMFGENPTEVVVKASHKGTVQFSNCSFWGPGHQVARIAGTGTVMFNSCNFVQWDTRRMRVPAIETFGGNLIVTGSNFVPDSPQLALRGETESAVFAANRLGGPLSISNPAKAELEVGLNVQRKPASKPVEEKGAVVVDDIDGYPATHFVGQWHLAGEGSGYYLGTRWAKKGTGDAQAVFTPNVPKAGRYEVYAFFGPDPMRDHAGNAPVTIRHADGTTVRRVDLRSMDNQWHPLGTFRFQKGSSGTVTFDNNADGNVLADAIKLVPKDK